MPHHYYFPRRRSVRLVTHDYGRSGCFFITITTKDGYAWFNTPEIRSIVRECWLAIPEHFPYVELDFWVVMPDHIHGIVRLRDEHSWKLFRGRRGMWHGDEISGLSDTLGPRTKRNQAIMQSKISPQRRTLAVVIRSFKGAVTTACRRAGFTDFCWHGRYHDRIIRDVRGLNAVRRYIMDNPRRWRLRKGNERWMRGMVGGGGMGGE
jgi:putative transposase